MRINTDQGVNGSRALHRGKPKTGADAREGRHPPGPIITPLDTPGRCSVGQTKSGTCCFVNVEISRALRLQDWEISRSPPIAARAFRFDKAFRHSLMWPEKNCQKPILGGYSLKSANPLYFFVPSPFVPGIKGDGQIGQVRCGPAIEGRSVKQGPRRKGWRDCPFLAVKRTPWR